MSVVVEHQHVFKTGGNDETHKLTYGEGPWQNSPAHQDVVARLNAFNQTELQPALEKIKKFSSVKNYFARSGPKAAEAIVMGQNNAATEKTAVKV